MIKYLDLGAGKRLNEIVMAGSHDAGITDGAGAGANAQTQKLDILGQAQAGVRFFDLRIAAFSTGNIVGGHKQVELTAFHADGMLHKKETKTRTIVGFKGPGQLERSKLRGGAQGMGLIQMLKDAKQFVTVGAGAGEFLILKFDKCTNWGLIADACIGELGGTLLAGRNLNTTTLQDLSGHVIAAFMPEGYRMLTDAQKVGITPIRNLYKPPTDYEDSYKGIQYWGAGGTKINNKSFDGKIEENMKTQQKILNKASTGVADVYKRNWRLKKVLKTSGCAAADPNALGMMYWTTTGLLKSIKDRNNRMWSDDRKGGLAKIWSNGFMDYFENAIPNQIRPDGGTLKMFMPNIVMIDFAKEKKCDEIYKLNSVASVALASMM
jgi:hypothetical protein